MPKIIHLVVVLMKFELIEYEGGFDLPSSITDWQHHQSLKQSQTTFSHGLGARIFKPLEK